MIKPIYLLIGDALLIEKYFERLLKIIQKNTQGEIHGDMIYLSEKKLPELFVLAKTLPFLAQAQYFRIKEAATLTKSDLEALSGFLKRKIPPYTYLIFEAGQLPPNADLPKLVAEFGEVVRLGDDPKLYGAESYIQGKLKEAGKRIEQNALKHLSEQMGLFPSLLDTVLDQIIAFSGEQETIDEAMVESFEENWKEFNVFHLTDALAERDTGKAILLFRQYLKEDGDDLVSLLGLLHWQLRRFWIGKVLLEENGSENAVLQRLKINPRQSRVFVRQLRNFPLPVIEKAIEELFQIDWQIKSGRAEGPEVFEQFLSRLSAK